ncbi:3-oxoacyl-[acyl-carrier-protein] synthase III C-terminal domain-containing protein [Spirochaeta cellobiosiphila]|uniref:3-oxoacyl-[acyl-carrier-protein] synthase III C-terminal domain-containing protein n=1 Tax=Spirochaeta cellobiosiphila TaxID=504483 RepID=UPI0004084F61|nr:3-oxoacyl-[acyl-carrier-protein] synthase III C-terminal domain-containing protein [Spirochaeta cellobiosiphila]
MNKLEILGHGTSLGQRMIRFGEQRRFWLGEGQDHKNLTIDAITIALNRAGLSLDEIDLIVFASAVGYQPIPSTSSLISEMLGSSKPIPCMDINTSCTSFITALDTISYLIEAGRYAKVLIVSAEVPSQGLNKDQKESYELFSDAAAAFIISKTDKNKGVMFAKENTWGEGAHHTEIRGGLSNLQGQHFDPSRLQDYLFDMKGREALRFTISKVSLFCKDYVAEGGIPLESFDKVIPHQASKALSFIMKRLNIPQDKYIDNVADYGNMVAVSVPYMLSQALDNSLVKEGDCILLLGTAAGLTINGLSLLL